MLMQFFEEVFDDGEDIFEEFFDDDELKKEVIY